MKSKTTMITVIILCLAGLAAFLYLRNRTPFEEEKPAVGETAPAISLADASGKMLRLADYRGKVVLVNFWASWCPPCKDEMPGFQKVHLAYENKGFVVIGIALDDVPPGLIRELGVLYPVVRTNERVTREYGDIAHVPVSFLINREGTIIKKLKGVYSERLLKDDVETALK